MKNGTIASSNGLTHNVINSKSVPVTMNSQEDFEKILADNFKGVGTVVAYLDYAVMIGNFNGSKMEFPGYDSKFDSAFIQKLRLFNKDKELFVWRTSEGFKARLRTDGDGAEINVIEAEQIVLGTDVEIGSDYSVLKEKRGTRIILPLNNLNVDEKKKRLKIKTRNYVGFDEETGQAGYCDCRFVEFIH